MTSKRRLTNVDASTPVRRHLTSCARSVSFLELKQMNNIVTVDLRREALCIVDACER